jgi:regulator of replication initiation timing
MSHSLSDLLLLYAQQFEDQHAPQNMTIALREAAKEIERLRAGGCARDQSTTQYCAEAARLAVENERLRAALEEIKALEGEINIGNYTHDDVVDLNNAFVEAFHIATEALEPRT